MPFVLRPNDFDICASDGRNNRFLKLDSENFFLAHALLNRYKINSDDFYELIQSDNQAEINRLSEVLIERMTLYIRTVHGANTEIARDCAQEAYGKVYAKILDENHDKMEDVFAYMIQSSKNEYLMKLRKEKFEVPFDEMKYKGRMDTTVDDVIEILSSEDNQIRLKQCIKKLKNKNRDFFNTIWENLYEDDKITAEEIGISYGSFRTRKSRIIDILRECVSDQKSNLF